MTWRGLAPGAYKVNVTKASGETLLATENEVGTAGEMTLALTVDAIDSVKLSVECLPKVVAAAVTDIAETPTASPAITPLAAAATGVISARPARLNPRTNRAATRKQTSARKSASTARATAVSPY